MEQVKLTPRLRLLADLVTKNKAADIGTDHGLLPIYLIQSGKCFDVILADINEGPLNKARENLEKYGIDPSFARLRLGNGLQVLENDKDRSVIIAGMGGELIADILGRDMEKSRSFPQFVLQPRTREAHLRRWLFSNGFTVTDERLVKERGRICQVICAAPSPCDTSDIPEDFFLDYPLMQFDGRNGALAAEYASCEIERLERLAENMNRSQGAEGLKFEIEKIRDHILRLRHWL